MYFHYIAKLCSPMIINKKWERLLKELEHLLKELPSKLQVEFALYCAKDVQHLAREKDKAIIGNAIRVTELWLIGKATADECFDASYAVSSAAYATCAASHAAYAASHAAYAAAYAASHAAYAAHAASHAAYAAYAASNASNAADPAFSSAAYAAHAASYSVTYDKELLKYLNYLKEMIESMPEVERLLLGVVI